ncbi:MAG: patatin-like phospholipase family protein [Chloroflexota bacterium]
MAVSQTLRQWLQAEPFTLSMSAGFFAFFAHCGVVSVLEEEGLFPAQITGASSGAMIGSAWASGCSAQLLRDFAFALRKSDFWDPGLGLGLLKGDRFRRITAQVCRVGRVEDCAIPMAISVYDIWARETVALRRGPMADVVSASAAMPGFFQPVRINGRLYSDGGIHDRPGLIGTESGQRIFYHHIASRSPWRRKNDPALKVPERDNMMALVVNDLVRANPNKLENGRLAFAQAREATQKALDQLVNDASVLYS